MKSKFTELNPDNDNDNERSYFNLIASNNPEIKNISKNNNIIIDNLSAAPEFNLNEKEIDSNNNNKELDSNLYENTINMIEKGFLPVFIKVDKYKPIFFFCNKKEKLKKIINIYSKTLNIENLSNYIFYKDDYELDVNLTIEDLNIQNFDIIRSIQLK